MEVGVGGGWGGARGGGGRGVDEDRPDIDRLHV